MDVVAVGADHVLALAQRLIGQHLDRRADRPDRAAVGAEGLADLLGLRGPEVPAERREELHLVEPVVPAHEREHEPLVRDDRHRLRGGALVHAQELRDVLDRPLVRGLHLLGRRQRLREVGRRRDAAGDLEIGRVVAVLAGDERVLPRPGRREEVLAAAAAHDARLGRHLDHLEAAALEDALVGDGVLAEALVEPGLVPVERVGVLHDELAHADQPGARPGLVAELHPKW